MNIAAILPEIILTVGAIVLMMVAAFGGRRVTGVTTWISVALLVVAAIVTLGRPQDAGVLFGGLIVADGFGAFGKVLIFLSAAVAIIAAHGWFERDFEHAAEYPVLILLATVGTAVMVSATSLMTLYVGLELSSLSGYVLAAYRRSDERSAEAGLKYFVLGGLASGILLYGISLLYGFTGTTGFNGIAAAFARDTTPSIGLLFGLVFTLAGMAFKISAVPFHMWTPDVYEGAPTPVTAFFASAPKVAAVLLATRICLDALAPASDAWRQIIIFAALASIALGAIAAYGQTNIKRLLAYSSINNVGFALIGLAAGGVAGASSVLFYMAVYVVMTLGAFLCVLRMRDANGEPVETLASLSGLSQSRPGLAAAIAIFMFSLAGIPPLLGFWPKVVVFQAAIAEGLYWLAVAGFLGSVIGAYYYIKIVKILYFDASAAPFAKAKAPVETALILAAALAVSPLGYLAIGPIGTLADKAAATLFLTRIRIVEATGSTNADLLADASAIEGDWLVALRQTSGKGRQGREWQSSEGNFAGSTLIVLRPGDPPPATLALAAGLALIEAVDSAAPGRDLQLKWPNDLMSGDAKLAGILLERAGDRVVAGFGVNLAAAPAIEGRATASLDRAIDPQAFAPLLAASLARLLAAWRSADASAFIEAWALRAHPVGTPLTVHSAPGETLSGRFDGLAPDGALRLRLDDGRIERVHAGDVTLAKSAGER